MVQYLDVKLVGTSAYAYRRASSSISGTEAPPAMHGGASAKEKYFRRLRIHFSSTRSWLSILYFVPTSSNGFTTNVPPS